MNYTHHPEYDRLPEPIKAAYTPQEYAWMTDEQRINLVENECLPDVEED